MKSGNFTSLYRSPTGSNALIGAEHKSSVTKHVPARLNRLRIRYPRVQPNCDILPRLTREAPLKVGRLEFFRLQESQYVNVKRSTIHCDNQPVANAVLMLVLYVFLQPI